MRTIAAQVSARYQVVIPKPVLDTMVFSYSTSLPIPHPRIEKHVEHLQDQARCHVQQGV